MSDLQSNGNDRSATGKQPGFLESALQESREKAAARIEENRARIDEKLSAAFSLAAHKEAIGDGLRWGLPYIEFEVIDRSEATLDEVKRSKQFADFEKAALANGFQDVTLHDNVSWLDTLQLGEIRCRAWLAKPTLLRRIFY